jgi:hypothetical protein
MPGRADISCEIDACRFLCLRDLAEPGDNCVRLVVQEAEVSHAADETTRPGAASTDYGAIASHETSRTFELVWQHYVAYAVRNEGFTTASDDDLVASGGVHCVYSRSHFLDYARHAAIARADYPGPLTHIGVICLNHIVDVVAVDLPVIRLLSI